MFNCKSCSSTLVEFQEFFLLTHYLSDPLEVSVLSSPTAHVCPPPDESLYEQQRTRRERPKFVKFGIVNEFIVLTHRLPFT